MIDFSVMHRRKSARAFIWIALHLIINVSALKPLYSVAEESKPGTLVRHMAKDLNLDFQAIKHKELRVLSESNVKYFDVDPTNGALVTRQEVDRERICGSSSSCHIRAQILLQKPLEAHHVTVEVVDVNDNAPVFQTKNASLDMSEAAAPGTGFRLESARDADVGINSLRSYFLSPNDYFILRVETKSDGAKLPVLVLNKPLDREKHNAFCLNLTAVEGGKPEQFETTQIFVNILDINDNAPEFDKPLKRVTILENSPVGTLVTSLTALDADHGANGEIHYSFHKYTSSHVLETFSVDPDCGLIRVTGVVDREQAHVYDITVQARDRGSPAMEGSCSIKVEIVDVNDNAPVVSNYSVSRVLSEDVSSGTVIRHPQHKGRRCWEERGSKCSYRTWVAF